MDFAIVMYFDEKSEKLLTDITQNLCNAGVNSYIVDNNIRPHITLASWMRGNEGDLTEYINKFSEGIKGFEVSFSGIGIFPKVINSLSVVYLSPVKNEELINVHNSFYKEFDDKISRFINNYIPQKWVPHCTVATKLTDEEVIKSTERLMMLDFPITARVSQIGFIKCYPIEDILSCNLNYIKDI